MRLLLALGGVGLLVAVVLWLRKNRTPADEGWVEVEWSGYQYGAMDPKKAVTSPGGGKSLSDYCQKMYGTNGQLIGMVPDKNAQTVGKANAILSDINCGTVKYAEKAIGAVIVTPAKALWNKIF